MQVPPGDPTRQMKETQILGLLRANKKINFLGLRLFEGKPLKNQLILENANLNPSDPKPSCLSCHWSHDNMVNNIALTGITRR